MGISTCLKEHSQGKSQKLSTGPVNDILKACLWLHLFCYDDVVNENIMCKISVSCNSWHYHCCS